MTVFKQTRLLSLFAACMAVLFIAGCGGEETDSADNGDVGESQYRMGEPITDSTYAIIVEMEGGEDETLTTQVFQERYQTFIQQVPAVAVDPTQSQELRRGIAEEFIRRTLIRAEAERLGLEPDTAKVAEQITMIRSSFSSEEQLNEILAQRGLTMDSLRSSIEEEVLLQQMQERMIEGATEPTAEELADFRAEQSQQVRAQHILFRVPEPSQKDSVYEQAETVLDSIQAGADFAEMAARYGSDGTRMRGGDLGYFSKNDMVAPFADAAFALSDSGDVAEEPVETNFGYHLIRLTGRRTAELMDSTQAQAMMMQERQREAFDAAYDELRQDVVIRINPDVVQVDLNEPIDQ